MEAKRLTEAALPVRFMAMALVWIAGTMTLGLTLGVSPIVFVLTGGVLALMYAYTRRAAARHAGPRQRTAGASSAEGDVNLASDVEHFIAKEFAAARRGRRVTLVMFGFSRFEAFAEREGAAATALALREFGSVLQRMTRHMNLTARYGWRANSFLSVLTDADAAAAEQFITRVREAVAAAGVLTPDIEAGIAVYHPDLAGPEEFVACAERALDAARAATLTNERAAHGVLPLRPAPRRAGGGPQSRAAAARGTSG